MARFSPLLASRFDLTGGAFCIVVTTREWRNRQTRTVQVRVPVMEWGFNSPLAHRRSGFRPGVLSSWLEATSVYVPSGTARIVGFGGSLIAQISLRFGTFGPEGRGNLRNLERVRTRRRPPRTLGMSPGPGVSPPDRVPSPTSGEETIAHPGRETPIRTSGLRGPVHRERPIQGDEVATLHGGPHLAIEGDRGRPVDHIE